MSMKLFAYAITIIHSQTGQIRTATGFLIAENKADAETLTQAYALKKYPVSEHWTRHHFKAIQAENTYTVNGRTFTTMIEVTPIKKSEQQIL